MANWLFSQTNSTGSFQMARFSPSWNAPLFTAPSPKNATATRSSLRSYALYSSAYCYLQQNVEGVSVVFVANGRRAVRLGSARQLIGEHAFGASAFGSAAASSWTVGIRRFHSEMVYGTERGTSRSP